MGGEGEIIAKSMYINGKKAKRITIGDAVFWEKPITRTYIYSNGTQYINTGIMNTGNYIFEGRIRIHSLTTPYGDGHWIVGGRSSSAYTVGIFIGSSGVFNGYGTTTTAQRPNTELGVWYTYKLSMEGLTLTTDNGVSNFYPIIGGAKLVPEERGIEVRICSITRNYANTSEDLRRMVGDHDYHKLTNAENNEVLYHYESTVDRDGVACFYDKVKKINKYSDGASDFSISENQN